MLITYGLFIEFYNDLSYFYKLSYQMLMRRNMEDSVTHNRFYLEIDELRKSLKKTFLPAKKLDAKKPLDGIC